MTGEKQEEVLRLVDHNHVIIKGEIVDGTRFARPEWEDIWMGMGPS